MSRVVFCFLLFIGTIFSDQENQDEGASFGIVFDTTGSMSTELRQVKNNAKDILENALRLPGNMIQDFVFAPFNDPEVPAATMTTSPSEFKGFLEGIEVNGGGDNPEMVYSALLNALKLVRPRGNTFQPEGDSNQTVNANVKVSSKRVTKRSTVFVFTDDLAKDQHLLPEILQLIVRKKVLIVDYMKSTQVPDEVNLVSVTKTGASEDAYPIAVDKTMEQFTASIAGTKAKITVRNPEGNIVTDKAKVVPILDLENVKVIKVNKPEPGVWNISSSSTSKHAFRLTGVSKLDFMSGFSAQRAASLKNTFQLPLRGIKHYVTLTSSNKEYVRDIKYVEIVSLDGTVLSKLRVKPISGHEGFYRAEAFLPPEKAFYVTVMAEGNDGISIKRTSMTGVVPAPPVKEMLTLADETDSGSALSYQPTVVVLSFITLCCSRVFNL